MDNSRQLPAMVRTDHGEANRRILAKETPTDFRRVEAAAITRRTSLHSAEGKRLFVRFFYVLQSRVYYISTIGRTRKSHQEIEALELQIKQAIADASKLIDRLMDAMEQRLKESSIDAVASFTTTPMEEDVAIVSAIGRRYFELIHKLDQLMPLLQTLEIEELVTETELDRMRAKAKRITGRPASLARLLADRLRMEMRDPGPTALPAAVATGLDEAAPAGSDAGISACSDVLALAQTAAVAAPVLPVGRSEPTLPELASRAAESSAAASMANGTARSV
ncbi:AcaB family transcriptional regulator [Azohydromonas aeria]|uniref:AcaB family transcriptional regulator n=1 Tax=Azohydromonas aeria TaxID=2590212 RepID=UPI0012F8D29D|nr:AcaB family transcriptional regulator [Azohydromonas aeria]